MRAHIPRPTLLTAALAAALTTGCGQTVLIDNPTVAPGDLDGDGVTAVDGDCDDLNASRSPNATEVCDGVDNDCSGAVDDLPDGDGDGYTECRSGSRGADCDDGDAAIHPGASEIAYDGIDQDCDGKDALDGDGDGFAAGDAGGADCDDLNAAIYPGATEIPYDGVDQDCSGADLTDVDGDGFDAEVVGGLDCDDDAALIHPDAPEGLDGLDNNCDGVLDQATLQDAPALWLGEYAYDGAGMAVAAAGDVDGDGLGDVLVGAPLADGAGEDTGKAYLLLGSQGSAARHADLSYASVTFVGVEAAARAGARVAGIGDVNGDGLGDLAIVAPGDAEVGIGAVYLIFGRADGWPSRLSLTEADGVIRGESPGDGRGLTVAAAGDLNGDGVADLAVGAPAFNGDVLTEQAGAGRGAVAIFWGRVDGEETEASAWTLTLQDADQLWLSEAADTVTGGSLAAAGDWTGDGRGELVIGAPGAEGGAGKVYVIFGDATEGIRTLEAADVHILGEDGDALGEALAAGGDLNSDGFGELALGAPRAEEGAGRVYLFLGKPSGLAKTLSVARADATLTGGASEDAFGAALALAPGAASADLWVGAPGAARITLFSGETALAGGSWEDGDATLEGDDGSQLGSAVAAAGIAGASGRGLIIAGAPTQLAGDEVSGRIGAGAAILVGGP